MSDVGAADPVAVVATAGLAYHRVVPGQPVSSWETCEAMKVVTILAVVAVVLAMPTRSQAHVFIETPAEGSTVASGAEVEVTWDIVVPHGAATYDLMFSADGGESFVMLLHGVTADTTSYAWTAPPSGVADAELLILQHGDGNYEFMNGVHFSVLGPDGEPVDEGPDASGFDAGGGDAASSDAGPSDGETSHEGAADVAGPEMMAMPEAFTVQDHSERAVPTTGAEVLDLLEGSCAVAGCHFGLTPQVGLDLAATAYPDNLLGTPAVTTERDLIECGDADASELILRLRGESGLRMPPQPEEPLSDDMIAAIAAWIEAGAPATGTFDAPPAEPCSVDPEPEPEPVASVQSGGCSTTGGSPDAVWAWLLLCAAVLLMMHARVRRGLRRR